MTIRKIIHLTLTWLLVITVINTGLIFFMLNGSQNDGKIVNMTAIVRGGTQRIAKLHMMNQPVDDLVDNLTKTIDGLILGNKSMGIPKATNKKYIEKMNEVKKYWENEMILQMIHEPGDHNPQEFYKKSEHFFNLTNDAVNIAESFSTAKIFRMKIYAVCSLVFYVLCFAEIWRNLSKKVLKPLKLLEKDVSEVALGKLSTPIDYKSNDELGSLAESMRKMIGNIRKYIEDIQYELKEISDGNLSFSKDYNIDYMGDFIAIKESLDKIVNALNLTVRGISESSQQVSISTSQVSVTMQMIAEGAAEEARSMDELTNNIETVSKHVENTADSAAHAGSMTQKVQKQIEYCGERMEEMIGAMNKIAESSAGIEKITNVIEDISMQTNMLALNASVEAVRAGDAGRGFSVVADEVRALANKSSESVKNTSVFVQESIAAVKNGEELLSQTADLLKEVIKMVQEVTGAVDSIGSDTAQQSSAIADIKNKIRNITDVVQNNSATTEESAAAGRELSEQANILKNLVGKFHLYNK